MQTMESSLQTIVADRLIATKGLKEIGDLYAVSIVDTAHKVRSGALSWEDGAKSIDASLAKSAELWKDYLATYLTPEEATLAARQRQARDRKPPECRLASYHWRPRHAASQRPSSDRSYIRLWTPSPSILASSSVCRCVSGWKSFSGPKDNKQMNFRLLAVFSALAFAVSAASLWTIFRGVSKPLGVMTGRMQQLAAG